MKIGLIGPGIMPIPPNGWGAVEMLIWDYYNIFIKNNIDCVIINTPNKNEIIEIVNNGNFDFVHLHYDVFIDIVKYLKNTKIIVSSHYPFINNPEKYHQDGYNRVMKELVNNKDYYLFASSIKDIETYIKFGADKEKIYLNRLGIKSESYIFDDKATYDKTLCFSQIINRKRQYHIQDIENIDFMGRLDDSNFTNRKNYKGEVSREFLNNEITKYSNFILLSSVENTTPLAVKEALVCGLGIVASESVAHELDSNLDFISIIEEDKINNLDYIKEVIIKNKNISINIRNEIRDYAIKKFELENILINEYIEKLKTI
jgi:hypothetical protein